MKNFKITADNKEYWVSRSVAVAAFIFRFDGTNWFILANKRGPGCPDNVGKWVCPCGYLDWDETGAQACARETFEECGLRVKPKEFRMIGVEDSPIAEYQNVTLRFMCVLNDDRPFVKPEGGEDKEVDSVKWIKIEDIDKYEWAFNHGYRIKALFDDYLY